MQQIKNVATHPVDVGGRVLASGESAELDPKADAVADGLDTGVLAKVSEKPAKTTRKSSDEES